MTKNITPAAQVYAHYSRKWNAATPAERVQMDAKSAREQLAEMEPDEDED